MDFVPALPMLVKMLASLAAILVAHRWLKNLWLSVLLGALCLGVMVGHSWETGLRVAAERLFSADNFLLMSVIFLVIWLSSQMSEVGLLQRLVESVRSRVGQRHALAVLPAVIGLLPMPGGAIFSAPLVDRCDDSGQVDPLSKARINYWFRHVWEFWWPLYPCVLLAMHLTGLDVWQFMLLGLPLSLAATVGGYFFLLRPIDMHDADRGTSPDGAPLHRLLAPIWAVIGGYVAFRLSLAAARAWQPAVVEVNRYVPMIFGILLALWGIERRHPLPGSAWRRILTANNTVRLALIVAAVRVYGALIEAPLGSGETPISVMQMEMAQWGIPVVAMIMVLPFVAGITTGLGIGYVGASFPIVIGLLGADPSQRMLWAFTVLAFACGHVGQMLSPVHVCLMVTNGHFRTPLFQSLRGLVFPGAVVILAGWLLYAGLAG